MVSHHKCAVKDCEDRFSVRHRFPNPRKFMSVFVQWIDCIGNETLQNLDPVAVYNNFRICHAHFTEDDVYTNNRLKKDAVPSVNLPEPQICSTSEQINGECLQEDSEEKPSIEDIHNWTVIQTVAEDVLIPPPRKFHTVGVQTDEMQLDEPPTEFNYFMCNRETFGFTSSAEVQVSLGPKKHVNIAGVSTSLW